MLHQKILLVIGALLFVPSTGWAQDTNEERVDFVADIKPIFESQCLRCHGPETEEAFRIDDRDATMDYIEPGDPDESDLMYHLTSDDEEEMMPPPDEGGPLDDADIQLIRRWIEQGADWPDDVTFEEPADSSDDTDQVGQTSDDASGASSAEDASKDGSRRKKKPEFQPNWTRAIGSLHPAILHLPMGLLLGAGLFALLSLRGNFVMSDCAYYCLWLGALGGILACVSGWNFGPMENYKPVDSWGDLIDTSSKLFWHRTSAIVVTVAAVLLALYAAATRNRNPDDGLLWKLGVILIAAGVGFVGHEGGELTWNRDGKHYRDLEMLMQRYLPALSSFTSEQDEDRGDGGKDAVSTSNEGGASRDVAPNDSGETGDAGEPASEGEGESTATGSDQGSEASPSQKGPGTAVKAK